MTFVDWLFQVITAHSIVEIVLSIVLCSAMGIYAYSRNILDASGAIASFTVGLVIALIGNIYWLITLIGFLIVTYVVTMVKYGDKKYRGLAQGKKGERTARNVLANGLVIALIPFTGYWLGAPVAGLLFITGISVASSDSFANEIGVISSKTYMITNLKKRVPPGTDGAISALGQIAATIGAFIPAIVGWFLVSDFNNSIISVTDSDQMPMTAVTLIIPVIIGIIGCQIDSLLGATLQQRKLLSNSAVNFYSILISVLIAFGIIQFINI